MGSRAAARGGVPTLVDPDGTLRLHWNGGNVRPGEVERELRAQIQVARVAGLHISHLDVYRLALWGSGAVYSMMHARTLEILAWGHAWRQRELDVLRSRDSRRLLEERVIRLMGWRDVYITAPGPWSARHA